jgi:hypothetical protein
VTGLVEDWGCPPVLHPAKYIVGAGADTRVRLGAICELILIIANIGTAVVVFPILKRQSEILRHLVFANWGTAGRPDCLPPLSSRPLSRMPRGVGLPTDQFS